MGPERLDGAGLVDPRNVDVKNSDKGAGESNTARAEKFLSELEVKKQTFQPPPPKAAVETGNQGLVSLGVLSKENPTVSNLLVGHETFGKDCWKIIHGDQNSAKPFERIPAGTEVFIDRDSREVVWGKEAQALARAGTSEAVSPSVKDGLDSLGTISSKNPTVSNLLVGNETYGKDCWKIIHGAQNTGKPFDRIVDGTEIFIDRNTREIVWGKNAQANKLGDGLVEAVKPYMGRDYKEVDCFDLVIKGLGDMGLQYQGTGGLKEKLIDMAKIEGRPNNSFISGEGLIKASGREVYTKVLPPPKDAEKATEDIMEEIAPLLEKGQILSFSMRTRGHTGVISQTEDRAWTYINSGNIDNSVLEGAPEKGVGEEYLIEEVRNWIELSVEEKEFLEISIGKLDENALAFFNRGGLGIEKRI